MMTFDTLAPTYDDDFTHSLIGTHLRQRVQERMLNLWQAGDSVLEIGCGTGEDAYFLGSHGIHVTATDVSDEMQRIARKKTLSLSHVHVQLLDLNNPLDAQINQEFSGVLSNFGALNCISDWRPLAIWLSSRVKSGGTLGFAVMSPFCIWETLWHGLHLNIQTATRRWRADTIFTPSESTRIHISYPTIKRLSRDFAPFFQRTNVYPLGLFLPPSDVYPVIEKRARVLKWLTSIDDKASNIRQLALFADHYWIEFKRV